MKMIDYMAALHQSETYEELLENLEAEEVDVVEVWEDLG